MAEENKSNEASLVEVPTQTTIAFKLEDGSLVDEKGLLIRIYNTLIKIEKAVA